MRKTIFISFFAFFALKALIVSAFGSLDSLLINKPDTEKITLLKKIVENSDSLPQILEAKQYLIKIYKKQNDKNKWFDTYLNLVDDYRQVSFFKAIKTLKTLEKEIIENIKDDTLLAKLYKKLGRVYEDENDYENAGQYYLKALKVNQKLNNEKGIASALNSLGLIYYYQGNYDLALKNFNQALPIVKKLNFKYGIATILSNMGIIYLYQNKLDSAKNIYLKVLELSKEFNDKRRISQTYNNLALVYQKQKNRGKAKFYLKKALEIKKELGDKQGQASIYTNLATIFIEEKNYNKALQYLKKAERIARKINSREYLKNIYNNYATVYEKKGDYLNAFKYEEKYVELKDSLITEEMQKQLMTLQTKYETEQKEQQIKLQKVKLAKVEAENKQKALKLEKARLQITFSIIGVILLLGVVFFIYRNYRQKQKLSEELSRRNHIIEATNEKLNKLLKELEAQKQHIELIHKELSESIDYSKRIQTSILPSFETLKKNVDNYFLIFYPRDKVSGDFYWWAHVEGKTIITVADCTGHGVPGAFMSMLGMSFLREIVEKEYITHPGIILKRLRKEIIRALKQKGTPGEQKDGMDMALIAIDHKKQTLQFAGANNPVYVVTNHKLEIIGDAINPVKEFSIEDESNTLYELKPDKMPIAIYEKMDKFNTIEIKYNQGDQVYLFSDGYADQFGGPKGKKFKYKALKNTILGNAHHSMSEQKTILEQTFIQWKNGYNQVDDVTLMGIKL